ncbi:LexA family transcriptional regulator [Nitratireductor basaltis]|uniref:Putative transcriptional regulator n=1 Tax=Nitratireductor basaltis TaxID=472175 RepID=A0A084UBN0_9HYPH|nr:LexA family transcriptional regulator [Nitratireductor basaltis]KFB10366.1 putative transcriptional regulator [Nitratireductor basaltis]
MATLDNGNSMNYLAILKALLEEAGGKQARLAEMLGVNQSSVSRWLKGGTIDVVSRDKITELAQQLDIINFTDAPVSVDKNSIPEIDVTGGLGGGGLVALESTARNGITFAKEVVRDHWRIPDWALSRMGVKASSIAAFPVQGDSMEPTLDDGDIVFIDTRHRVPSPPGVYALADEFGGVVVKRLDVVSKPSDDVVVVKVSSDNPRHPERELTLDEITIIGRFIGRFTT